MDEDREVRRSWLARWWLPLLLVPAAVIIAIAVGVGGSDSGAPDGTSDTSEATPGSDVAVVDSTAGVDPVDLAELASISPLIVVGRVESVERGRVFASSDTADGDGSGIESALVTVSVEQVVAGADPGLTILVEEEGWLADGRRISLDGAPPTEVGDRALWFLVDTGDAEVPAWVTVGRVGRWVERDGVLTGPLIDEPIAIDLQDRPVDDVVAEIQAGLADPSGASTTTGG